MKRNVRNRIVAVLSLLVLVIVLAACANSGTLPEAEAPAAPVEEEVEAVEEEVEAVEEEVEAVEEEAEVIEEEAEAEGDAVPLEVFVQQGALWDFENNWFTQYAEEMFNIDFNWQTTTWDPAAAREARQIGLASGEYPDLYLLIPWVDSFSQQELIRYGQQGVILPLNDLIEEHAPNIQRVFEDYPWFAAHVTAPDGNIYGMTQLIGCYHCAHAMQMWINGTWLDTLGLEMPETTEEFEAVLQAFQTQDPNGNGEADEIPLTGNVQFVTQMPFPFLLNAFTYYAANDINKVPLYLEGDEIRTVADNEDFRAGLAYVADLYAQGLIDPGAFSQNLEGMQQLGNNAEAVIVGAAPAAPRGWMQDNERLQQYVPVPPLTGPEGVQYAFYGSSTAPGATFVLTNQASPEAQVAAIKLLDFMFTDEGQLVSYWGEEGVDWRRPEEGEVAVNPAADPLFADIPVEAGTAHQGWQPVGQYYQPAEWRDRWVVGEDIYLPENYSRWLQEATDLYAEHVPEELVVPYNSLWIDPALVDEAATLQTNLGDYIMQNTFQFITGGLDLESDWDPYVSGLYDLGLERYLEILQEAYETYLTTAISDPQ